MPEYWLGIRSELKANFILEFGVVLSTYTVGILEFGVVLSTYTVGKFQSAVYRTLEVPQIPHIHKRHIQKEDSVSTKAFLFSG